MIGRGGVYLVLRLRALEQLRVLAGGVPIAFHALLDHAACLGAFRNFDRRHLERVQLAKLDLRVVALQKHIPALTIPYKITNFEFTCNAHGGFDRVNRTWQVWETYVGRNIRPPKCSSFEPPLPSAEIGWLTSIG